MPHNFGNGKTGKHGHAVFTALIAHELSESMLHFEKPPQLRRLIHIPTSLAVFIDFLQSHQIWILFLDNLSQPLQIDLPIRPLTMTNIVGNNI